jgi:hypothetical protein
VMPKCEFGDCKNYPITTMKLSEHAINICVEHKIPAYRIVSALGLELHRQRATIILEYFKTIQQGGKT